MLKAELDYPGALVMGQRKVALSWLSCRVCCLHLQASLKVWKFFQAYGVSTITSAVADPRDCLHYWL